MQVEGSVPKSKTVMKYLMLTMLLFAVIGTGVAQTAKKLVLTANVSESACAGSGHTVALQASGGTAPYAYKWSDGQSGAFRKGLKEGTYTCTVTDAGGNSSQKSFRFQPTPAPLEVKINKVKGQNAYQVKAEVTGGKAPYTYYWFGQGLEAGKAGVSTHMLSPGTYQLAIQDSNGCSSSVTLTLEN